MRPFLIRTPNDETIVQLILPVQGTYLIDTLLPTVGSFVGICSDKFPFPLIRFGTIRYY